MLPKTELSNVQLRNISASSNQVFCNCGSQTIFDDWIWRSWCSSSVKIWSSFRTLDITLSCSDILERKHFCSYSQQVCIKLMFVNTMKSIHLIFIMNEKDYVDLPNTVWKTLYLNLRVRNVYFRNFVSKRIFFIESWLQLIHIKFLI